MAGVDGTSCHWLRICTLRPLVKQQVPHHRLGAKDKVFVRTGDILTYSNTGSPGARKLCHRQRQRHQTKQTKPIWNAIHEPKFQHGGWTGLRLLPAGHVLLTEICKCVKKACHIRQGERTLAKVLLRGWVREISTI